jgi:hypothetical protein
VDVTTELSINNVRTKDELVGTNAGNCGTVILMMTDGNDSTAKICKRTMNVRVRDKGACHVEESSHYTWAINSDSTALAVINRQCGLDRSQKISAVYLCIAPHPHGFLELCRARCLRQVGRIRQTYPKLSSDFLYVGRVTSSKAQDAARWTDIAPFDRHLACSTSIAALVCVARAASKSRSS